MSIPTPSTSNTRSAIRQIFEGAVAASNSGYGRSAEKKCSPRAFLSLTQTGRAASGGLPKISTLLCKPTAARMAGNGK
jgi:hypothetical protein